MSKKSQRRKVKKSRRYGTVADALRSGVEACEPFASDSRVAALSRDLQAKLSAWEKASGPDLADALVTASKSAAKIAPGDAHSRAQVSKAMAPAQLHYLREMSPASADAWEAARVA